MVHPSRAPQRPGPPIAVALLVAFVAVASPFTMIQAQAAGRAQARGSGVKTVGRVRATKKAAPKSKVIPNQEGKIVVFPFKDDDDHTIGAQVERLFRSRGLEVMTGVRPVDTAEQYRDMATAMGLVAYVDGTLREGETNASVTVHVRSGYSGRRVASTTFKESRSHLRAEIEDKLWTKVGPTMSRTCADAGKPRRRGRGPLIIEAGTPIESPAAPMPAKPRSAPSAKNDVDPGA